MWGPVCGSDEYGVPITLTAEKEGITPKELVDRNHASIKKSFEDFGMSFDKFEIGYRAKHLSNAGLDDNNPGINFHMIRFGYRF